MAQTKRKHESVMAFQRADELARAVFKVTRGFPPQESTLRTRLRAQAVTVPSRVAAAVSASGKEERLSLLKEAIVAAKEVDYAVSLAASLGYFKKQETASKLGNLAGEVAGLVTDFRDSLSL